MFHLQRFHHRIGHALAGMVDPLKQAGRDPQARSGRRVPDIPQPGLQGPQGLPGPLAAHVAEQSRRKRVPLRATGRIVTDRHVQTQPIAPLALEWRFPPPRPTSIAATRVCQDQEARGLRVHHTTDVLPPPCHRPDRALRRIPRGPHRDGTVVVLQVVDAGRYGAAEGIAREVMHVDFDRVLTPELPGVLEVPDPRFRLGVHPDDRTARHRICLFLCCNVWKRRVAVWMLSPRFFLLRMDTPGIVVLLQQPADGRDTGGMSQVRQSLAQRAQTPAPPLPGAHRIARGVGRDDLPQGRVHDGVFFSARERPAPGARTRSVGCSASDAASSCRPRWIEFGYNRSLGPRTGHPCALDGSTRRLRTSEGAVPASATGASACGDAAIDRDAWLLVGHADIGTDGLRY